ncbi:MAG: acetyl-CoA hydrolase/transferase C-terminal domain-containing protein [Micrococcales bacterium]|nr:acetyl-CoA hydrolase/transferase C-terminal domain-containing protein [Micrococcales bacterium]
MAVTSLESLSSIIDVSRRNLRVVVSGNGAVPWTVVGALDELLPGYRLHMLNAPAGLPDRTGVVLESAFVGVGMRRSDRLAYLPCRLSQVPRLFARRLPVDIVLLHTSTPINNKVSMGIEVNILPAAIESAKAHGGIVIAQANPHMPYTYGDGEYDVSIFDAIIEVDEPLGGHSVQAQTAAGAKAVKAPAAPSKGIDRVESAQIIGRLVSDRISDGSTLQMGIGEIPDATLAGLLAKKGLGIWTEMLADGVLALDDAGALDPDRMLVSSFVHGSATLNEWVHRNDRVRILRTETTNAPSNISKNPLMTSINTALQVDLLDQANASRIRARIHSGFGGQTDFTVGAMHAPGGQAIMALRSWHPKADQSTIVPLLDEPVTSFQHTAVVTENGVAEIHGCDENTQAANLIEFAAHPRIRDELWEEAVSLGLV